MNNFFTGIFEQAESVDITMFLIYKNIYKIFQRQSIDTSLLVCISIALNRNFLEELAKEIGDQKSCKKMCEK